MCVACEFVKVYTMGLLVVVGGCVYGCGRLNMRKFVGVIYRWFVHGFVYVIYVGVLDVGCVGFL